MNNDKNTLDSETIVGKMSRYAKVSSTIGGLVAKLAGHKYLGLDIDKGKHADKLSASLGNLKGPLLKVAQLLATVPNALPKEYAEELQKLQANAPAMGWPFVKRRMRAELGANWQSKFKYFSREAVAAASLGQVHKAVTLDNIEIACKLQYPDMKTAVKSDLSQLKIVLNLFEKYDKSISTADIYQEIAERLYEELDYIREAKCQKLYAYMLRNEDCVNIPEVIDELSTERLLSTNWLDGKPILSFKEGKQEIRDKIALNLFKAWYTPLYNFGVIHGDPHAGNYTVAGNLNINLLDFGCIRIFPPKFIAAVIMLYHALQKNDKDMAAKAYEDWGFKNLNNELLEVLNNWAKFLYGPILDDKKRKIGELGKTIYGKEIAEKTHQELKKLGGVRPPPEFVFMDRAALGMGSIFLHLGAKVNWYQIFNELIEDFNEEKLAKTQKLALKKFNLT